MPNGSRTTKLSRCEQEVLSLTARGKSLTEIAAATGRSYSACAVSHHRIREKLGIGPSKDLRVDVLVAENARLRQRVRELEARR